MCKKVRVVNYNDPGYLNPVMNNTVTDYQVFFCSSSSIPIKYQKWHSLILFCVFNNRVDWIILIYILSDLHWSAFPSTVLLQQCLDSVGPFWSASDQSRVGLAEDMQVLFLFLLSWLIWSVRRLDYRLIGSSVDEVVWCASLTER